MNESELENYLHRNIPLSLAMQVSVESVGTGGIVLAAPLAPNINHRETLFGGSAAAIAILAAWSLLHVRMRAAGVRSRLVIRDSAMHYDRPVTAAFTARSFLPDADAWDPFLRTLARKGKARITVAARIEQEGASAGRFEGQFAALAAAQR